MTAGRGRQDGGRRRTAIAALLLALAGTPARAETLADAIADAYRGNPQLQAQRAELRALDETVIEALSPYRIGATINSNIAYNERRQRGVSSNAFTVFEQRSIGASMSITQLLSSGGRVAAQVSAAEADVLSGRERLREIENAILFEVVDAYVSVRRDQQLVAIQAQAVANYERQVAQNQSREGEGDLSMTDVQQARAQLLIIRAALAQARAAQEQLRVGQAAVTAAEAALGGVRRGFAEGFRSNFEVIDSEQRLLNAQVLVVNARYSLFAGQSTLLAFIGRLQAATLFRDIVPYDATENLKRQRRDQFGPFVPLVRAFDSIQRPSGRGRQAPAITPVAGPLAAPSPPPDGPLANALPLSRPPADAPLSDPANPNQFDLNRFNREK